jgi:parvulin-like peptidyl-prolyl isomerase
MRTAVIILAMLVVGVLAAGCADESSRKGPLTPIAPTPPGGGYALDREPPGGAIEAVEPYEAPVAKPLKDSLPPVAFEDSEPVGTSVGRPTNGRSSPRPIPAPSATSDKTGPDQPALPAPAPDAGATVPLANAVLAEVNGDVITREDILGPLRPQIEQWRKDLPPDEFENRCRYYISQDLRKEISRRLVLQEAKATLSEAEKDAVEAQLVQTEKNLISEAGSRPRLEERFAKNGSTIEREKVRQRDHLLIQRLLRQKVVDIQVTHGELLALYEKVKADRYELRERAHLLMITLKKSNSAGLDQAQALAQAVQDKASHGEDFAKLAARYSSDPMAQKGGDWGLVGRGSVAIKAVDAALFSLRPGEVAPLIETNEAFYIVKCQDREEARTKPFTEVQTELERELRDEKRNDAIQKYIQDLYEKAFVRVMTENL